jgi:hypothetical protein
MITFYDAIMYLDPNCSWECVGGWESYENFYPLNDCVLPSKEACLAVWEEIETKVAFDVLRVERDRLLEASDWTQMLDAPVGREAWAIYRQALRDLPENTVDPKSPVWPTPPA